MEQAACDVTVWVSASVMRDCLREADEKHPLETGGTFMGWWSATDTAVITGMIGPGPGAYHGGYQFQPDQEWQLEQIARLYELSGRRETYLGDWHSHPDAASGMLSWTDRGVLRRVISTPAARCLSPLMMILWGSSGAWNLTTWQARTTPRVLRWDKLVLHEVQAKTYDLAGHHSAS